MRLMSTSAVKCTKKVDCKPQVDLMTARPAESRAATIASRCVVLHLSKKV